MNKKYFLTLNSFILTVIIATISWYFSKDFISTILAVVLGVGFYFLLSYSLVEEVFSIEEKLKEKMQKTMHELNTPVSTIQINSKLLSKNVHEEKSIQRLSKIDRACRELLRLYDEMEYFIQKNIDSVEIKSYDLKELVDISVGKFDDIKKDVLIMIDINQVQIKTDKNGFITILDNLIQNALKHNQNITKIEIFLKDKTLFVKDDGEGIDSENICNVFNKYFSDHKAKGFGLGLSLVKEFCDKNSIDIKIDSSEIGTTFKLGLSKIIVVS